VFESGDEAVWPRVYEHSKGVTEWVRGQEEEGGFRRAYDPLKQYGDAIELLVKADVTKDFHKGTVQSKTTSKGMYDDKHTPAWSYENCSFRLNCVNTLCDSVGEKIVAVFFMGTGFFRAGVMCDLLVFTFKNYLFVDTSPSGIEGFLLEEKPQYTNVPNAKRPNLGISFLGEGELEVFLPKICASCKRYRDRGGSVKLSKCGGCAGSVIYCRRECQKKGWNAHKNDCKARKKKIKRLKELRERFREGHPLVGEVGGYEEKQVMEFLKNNPYSDELSYRESCLFDLECEGGGD